MAEATEIRHIVEAKTEGMEALPTTETTTAAGATIAEELADIENDQPIVTIDSAAEGTSTPFLIAVGGIEKMSAQAIVTTGLCISVRVYGFTLDV